MIFHKELINEFRKQVKIWREYKEKILELRENQNKKKNDSEKNKETDDSEKDKETDDSEKDKETDDSEKNKETNDSEKNKETDDSEKNKETDDSEKNKETDDSEKNKDSEDNKTSDIEIINERQNETFSYVNDTIENEKDYRNSEELHNNLKNKTKLGIKILKALRLLFLRLMIKTHPDKVGDKFLMQFKEAKNAHENSNIDDLIMIAIEVNSSIDKLPINIDIKILLEAILYKIEIFKKILNDNL
jgi:hypothetical protein